MKFCCVSCNEIHDTEGVAFGFDAPAPWLLLTEEEKKESQLSGEQCIIVARNEIHWFVRGCLEIPIKGSQKSFSLNLWVSLSKKSYAAMAENWENPERVKQAPYFGWLCSKLPGYPDTMFLKTMVHQRAVGLRPLIELEPTDHPLAVQQREGIAESDLQIAITSLLH
jgi:hypothetical protein